MVSEAELERLCKAETDRVEWKQSTSQRDPLLQAVCALANDLGDARTPGFVVIGLTKSGALRGIDGDGDIDQQQQEVANRLRSSKIQPVPSVTVNDRLVEGRTLLIVQVEPYPVPPVVEVDGRAWVRIGTTTQRANQADLQRLNERRPLNRMPFDTRPMPTLGIEDLEVGELRRVYGEARDTDEDPGSFPAFESWLVQRQYGTGGDGQFIPNAASVLLFGKSPQDHLPSAWIDCVRYRGAGYDADIVSRRSVSGTLTDQLDVGWSWLAAQIENVPVASDGIRSAFGPNYPEDALKELLRNLVQHRLYEGTNAPGRVEWFEDRIEFSNPGGPFGRASEGEFGSNSDYRNPLLTARLVAAGYVQQLGRGVRRAQLLLQKNANPPLEVQTDGFTRVTVRRRA